MIAKIEKNGTNYKVDLSQPLDISIPLRAGKENVNAWYVDPVKIEPVRTEHFTGSVKEGGSVNFKNIFFNPHGNGTHTECVGHISKEDYTINQCLKQFWFTAKLVSVTPIDNEITEDMLAEALIGVNEALIIRTLPNSEEKINRQYSNTEPPYITTAAMKAIREAGVQHLLIDLPSVDPEFDDGKLTAHHLFWQYPETPLLNCTITELIYVPNDIIDGEYLLNIQIASFESDASPSKPILYKIIS